MPNPKLEAVPNYPFTAFKFSVEIKVPGIDGQLYAAAFAECDGLEMNMEVKTIREGGNNGTQIRLPGPLTYGQLILKRGMTANLDMWQWFGMMTEPGKIGTRADVLVVLLAPDGSEQLRFILTRCLPVKLKAPALNAKDGVIAVEEMQIAYETLSIQPGGAGPGSSPAAPGAPGAGLNISISASLG
jgi:phage tail-like protein